MRPRSTSGAPPTNTRWKHRPRSSNGCAARACGPSSSRCRRPTARASWPSTNGASRWPTCRAPTAACCSRSRGSSSSRDGARPDPIHLIMTVTATHPRDALFDADETTATALPVCDHYCGVEMRMRKSLALQAELGPVFDITLDCEDGAPIGGEAAHAHMVAELAMSAENRFERVGARVHPIDHPSFADDIATLIGRAGERLAYLMLPKPRSLADVERACAEIDHQSRVRGLARALPVHVLIE